MVRNDRDLITRSRLRVAVTLAVLALAGQAWAASLQVAPTSLTLQATQNADGLWLSNSGDEDIQVQLRVFRWTQADGEESLTPTRDLVISPPMQTIPPGQRQLVRVIRTAPTPAAEETSYRVIVDELPTATPQQGLQFVLRYSIPIFIVPATPAAIAPRLQARLLTAANGGGVLEISNHGTQHAQIADLSFGKDATAMTPLMPGLVGYVLTGQTMRWPLTSPASRFAGGAFKARINSEADEQPLPVAPAAR